MNIIIFSKNRGCQLDLFLSSMAYYCPLSLVAASMIIYKATDSKYQDGYAKCQGYHSCASFIPQGTNFKDDVLDLVQADDPYTVFFVDDIVWKGGFSVNDSQFIAFSKSDKTCCLSLRLHPGINYSYAVDHALKAPTFLSKWFWAWRQAQGDWAYPMSLDGHIFRTRDILPLLKELKYDGPNQLEGELTHRPFKGEYMRCYGDSPIVNIPNNKVQECVLKARSAGGSAEALNENFLKGKRLKFEQYAGIKNKSVHEVLPLEWRA
jgi:hypothetical protein